MKLTTHLHQTPKLRMQYGDTSTPTAHLHGVYRDKLKPCFVFGRYRFRLSVGKLNILAKVYFVFSVSLGNF